MKALKALESTQPIMTLWKHFDLLSDWSDYTQDYQVLTLAAQHMHILNYQDNTNESPQNL